MGFKAFSIALGILAGTAGVTNTWIRPRSIAALVSLAFAGEQDETVADGVSYKVEMLRYIEKSELIGDNRMGCVRKFSDGTVETLIVDMRSNMVEETHTEKVKLTDGERLEIKKSPYKRQYS